MSELIEFLRSLGATDQDLEDYADELPGLASIIFMRPGKERLSLREVTERAGISLEEAMAFWRVTGFADVDPDAKVSSEAEVAVMQLGKAAQALFGEEAALQLSRVIGSSLARIADAAVSTFLVNLERPLHDEDDVDMAVARANADAGLLIAPFMETVEVLLRRHLIAARRSLLGVQVAGGMETQRLAIGFVDLVGSTALAQATTLAEMGAVLSRFEEIAQDAVAGAGARLVKLIGDEVMFSTPSADVALSVAGEIVNVLRSHPQVPPVRAGLGFGDVMTRDGDCFGPIVNIAARAVKLAQPSQVVMSAAFRGALSDASRLRPMGPKAVKGIDEPLEFWTFES